MFVNETACVGENLPPQIAILLYVCIQHGLLHKTTITYYLIMDASSVGFHHKSSGRFYLFAHPQWAQWSCEFPGFG